MYFKSKDREIYYELAGQGPSLVFCHGYGGNHVVWCQQVAYFQKNYQTLVFDQAGHGASRGSYARGIRDLIDDTAALIKHLALPHPILVGHSMGASVVWGLLKYHPEIKVDRFITIDQSPKMLNDHSWPYGYLNLTAANYQTELRQKKHVKETLHGLADSVYQQLAPFKKQHPFNQDRNLPLLLDHVRHDWRPLCRQTLVPGLLLSSKKSPYFKYGYAQQLAQANPHLTATTVTDTGHDVMAENPSEFNRILADFLKE